MLSWNKPSDPQKARQVADQGRIYACISAVVLASEVFDAFLSDIGNTKWLSIDEAAKEIASKKIQRKKGEGGDWSSAERASSISDGLNLKEPLYISALDIFSK